MAAARQADPAPRRWVERLIADLFEQEDIVYTVVAGAGLSFAELTGRSTPTFAGDWWTVETASWHIHARIGAITTVRFVREPSSHTPGEESLSVALRGAQGERLLEAYFVNLYDRVTKQPREAAFGRWEAIKACYGGQAEYTLVGGEPIGSTTPHPPAPPDRGR